MKTKATAAIMVTMLLVGMMFSVLPTKAFVGTIKVGIIGPVGLPHWLPAGMLDAAEIARNEINAAGGISLPGGDYELVLKFGDEHSLPPDPDAAKLEVRRLIVDEGCQFIIGGFRTEVVGAMIEEAMFWETMFLINGASTDELISETVGDDYAKYKYLFRVNPTNSTVLFKTLGAFTAYGLIPKLLPLYGYVHAGKTVPQVDVAVVTEALKWTETMHMYLTNPAIYPAVLGPYVNVTYGGRIPDGTTDCTPWLNDVIDSKARIMIHVFSGVTGVPLIMQWHAMGVKAVPFGINVMAQLQSHWPTTGGACEHEGTLNFVGTRTPIIPGETDVFWDNFLAYTLSKYGTAYWPIYTAFGAYGAIYTLVEAIETAGTVDPGAGHGASGVITALEQIDTIGVNGKFKFTYDHDVFSNELGPTWKDGYIRALMIQWQAGRMEVVYPMDQPYSRTTALPNTPTQMYPYPTDVHQDGEVDAEDLSAVGYAFGSSPGHERWQFVADVDDNYLIDGDDLTAVCYDFAKTVALPLPYCNEADRWVP